MTRKVAKYKVTLTKEERSELEALISGGKSAARKLCRARILLKADAGVDGPAWDDRRISEAFEVGRATAERVRKEFVEQGLEVALERKKPDREYARRLDGQGEASERSCRMGARTEPTILEGKLAIHDDGCPSEAPAPLSLN